MKNRKNMFILAIVALVLVLGVGYAVVSQVALTISGSSAGKQQDLKVVYDNVNSGTTNGTTNKVTAISSPDDSRAATFTVTDMVLNTPVSLDFEIINKEDDVNALLATPTITNDNSEYFTVTTQYKAAAMSAAGEYASWTSGTKTLVTDKDNNVNNKATIRVVVTMIKTPVKQDDNEANIGVTINASPIDNANN